MNKGLKTLVIVMAVIIVILLGILIFVPSTNGPTAERGPGAGVPSVPAVSADGHVTVNAPLAGELIASPVTVSGTVVGGGWFFEAQFPVQVLDGDGTPLGGDPAKPVGDPGLWTSTGTVPFSATVSFAAPKYATGTVVLSRDNPSGLPQYAGELRIPVRFK